MMIRKLPSIVLAVALGGCAAVALGACAGRYEWSKEGESEGAAEVARKECRDESRDYGFLDGRDRSLRVMTARGERYAEISTNTAEREASMFGDCMRAKGFELVPRQEE
jgi:hypothetical protein